MSRICQVTGKRAMRGHNVSHANNKTNRLFAANLRKRRFWLESQKRWLRLRVSKKAMRIIDRDGIDAVVEKMQRKGLL